MPKARKTKILIHIGEGDDRETYEYDQGRMLNTEFAAMERVTGLVGIDLEDALNNVGAQAMTALIWVLRKRTSPRARLEDVIYENGTLSIEQVNADGTPIEDDGEEVADQGEPAAPKADETAGSTPSS